ncbi:MAG: hypothetical protein ABIM85_07205 [candidate division WOR-3 bacterium]
MKENLSLDQSFIINEPGKTLKDRFEQLIKDYRFFDTLVVYFYPSGFYKLHRALENNEKIKFLLRIGTSSQVFRLIKEEIEKIEG